MRLLTLAALAALTACDRTSGESCPWVPGDDGTCSGRDSGGCSSADEPPPTVSFLSATLSRHRVVVRQRGAEGEHLWSAALDARGVPEAAIERLALPVVGEPALWSGLDGALLTMASDNGLNHPVGITAAPLDRDGRVAAQVRLTDEIPEELEAVFDGEAYVVAWIELDLAESGRRLAIARILPDGAVTNHVIAIRFDGADGIGPLGLATDGAGEVLLTWPLRPRLRRLGEGAPGELHGLRLHDGVALDAAPVLLAVDGADGCLRGGTHTLVRTGDQYRVLIVRSACHGNVSATGLRDLTIDVTTAAVTEVPSPLPFATPPAFVAGGDGAFLALVESAPQQVDASLATARPAELPDAALGWRLAVSGTETGYAMVLGRYVDSGSSQTDLVTLGPAFTHTALATGYQLPVEDGDGCSTGGSGALAPAALTLVALLRRRRRRRITSGRGSASCSSGPGEIQMRSRPGGRVARR